MAENFDLQKLTQMAEPIIQKLTGNKDLLAAFTKDPVGLLEKTFGIDLPDEQINKLIELIKSKVGTVAARGILARIKAMFAKK